MQVAPQITGRFRPGQSGNPRGRLPKAEQRARVAAQADAWAAELGSKVGSYERGLLTRAAELSLLPRRRTEDAIRTANTIARLLGQAGFRARRLRKEPSDLAKLHGETA